MPRTRQRRQSTRAASARRTRARSSEGEQYLQALIAEQQLADEEDADRASDVDDDSDDDGSVLLAADLTDVSDDSISETSSVRDDRDESSIASDAADENEVSDAAPPGEIAISGQGVGNDDAAPPAALPALEADDNASCVDIEGVDLADLPKVKGRSMGHHHFKQNKLVFVSLDLETGGEGCGIVQISAEIVRPVLQREGKMTAKDQLAGPVERGTTQYNDESNPGGTLFNEYVNPGEDAEWSEKATEVTGLTKDDPRITTARSLNDVWTSFCLYIHNNIAEDERGVIVAYNGAGCDMKWLWRLTQAPNSTELMPERLAFYMDPLKIMKKWKSCRLHKKHSKLDCFSLGNVWSYINDGRYLPDLHDSLVDAKAQVDLLLSAPFVPFIDRTDTLTTVDNIFGANQLRELQRELEPIRPVHEPWVELNAESDLNWEPSGHYSYTGSAGGSLFGPTSAILTQARTATNLACMFFFLLPLSFFAKIAAWTDQYCYKDWVVEKVGRNRDGNLKTKSHFEDVPELKKGQRRPKTHRHRGDREKTKYAITVGFVICWVAHLILQGAVFGSTKPDTHRLYTKGAYGVNVPILRNSMKRDAVKFMRRYIHFCDNSKRKGKGQAGYDPLYKIAYALDEISKGLRRAWKAGQRVTIDESMIKYMGRAVPFVQYMPAKPIKHGLKVFCLCCSVSGVMLAFEVYCGSGDDESKKKTSALEMCEKLCDQAGLLTSRGRVLYTDNYYTSIKLAKHMFDKYGWSVVGTTVPTEKKDRQAEDFPFLKLSNGARNSVHRGWFREAVIKLKSPSGTTYYIQATTWRDKKQVCFISSSHAAFSNGLSVKRHVRGKRDREIIDGVRAQLEYTKWMNAVDRNDRDSADYSTSIRSNRYYLRIFCWALDRVVHCLYCVICWCATNGIGPKEWRRYLKSRNGRREFQIDLAIDLINYAIALDWDGGDKRPSYIRSDSFIPCDCKKCIFCVDGHTGIIRGVDTKKPKSVFHYQCGGRLVSEGCTTQRVNLDIGNQYCRMCYRLQDPAIPCREREKKATTHGWGALNARSPSVKRAGPRDTISTKKKINK